MAGKMPAGAYGGYPPPGPPPPYQAYPQSGTTVVVQSKPTTTVVQHKPARGLFGSMFQEAVSVGNQLGREFDRAVHDVVHTTSTSPLLSLFTTGNVIQLISRMSGKPLQILMGHNGQLIVSGNGPLDSIPFNTTWTVVNEGNNQVRLHNNYNFLTIYNGQTSLVNMPVGSLHGVETKWQLSLMENFVLLESMKERGRHIGVLPSGELKPALACGRERHAQFGVKLVSSPHPQAGMAPQYRP